MKPGNNLTIRPSQKNDIASLAMLMTELGYPTSTDEMMERFLILDKEPGYKIFIAEVDGDVAGMAGAFRNYYFEKNGSYVRLAVLVTKQTYRKLGIGKALVKAVEMWASTINATAILVNCGNREERKDAHDFYNRNGFISKSTGYIKPK